MNFMQALESFFAKFTTFSGRASRSEFWWNYLFWIIVSWITSFIDGMVNFRFPMISAALGVMVILPWYALAVRRLHDVDRSGWWWLIAFTLVGIPVLLYWSAKKGSAGENRFGSNPLTTTSSPNTQASGPVDH